MFFSCRILQNKKSDEMFTKNLNTSQITTSMILRWSQYHSLMQLSREVPGVNVPQNVNIEWTSWESTRMFQKNGGSCSSPHVRGGPGRQQPAPRPHCRHTRTPHLAPAHHSDSEIVCHSEKRDHNKECIFVNHFQFSNSGIRTSFIKLPSSALK